MMFHSLGRLGDDNSAGAAALAIGDPSPSSATDLSSAAPSDCTPGTSGCVPHWYCYIPFMATPDCLASFKEGTSEVASAGASAVTGTVAAAASGVASGVASGIADGFNNANSGNPGTNPFSLSLSSGLILAVGGGLLAFMFLSASTRR